MSREISVLLNLFSYLGVGDETIGHTETRAVVGFCVGSTKNTVVVEFFELEHGDKTLLDVEAVNLI
jgi:hypothetical protein